MDLAGWSRFFYSPSVFFAVGSVNQKPKDQSKYQSKSSLVSLLRKLRSMVYLSGKGHLMSCLLKAKFHETITSI